MEEQIKQLEDRLNKLEKMFESHKHNGIDSVSTFNKQNAITAPTGGTTVDSQARTAIGTIITTLQALKLTR